MAGKSEAAFQEIWSPRRRYEQIRLGPCHWHEGEQALYFTKGTHETMVCVTPADLDALRAALM